MSDLRDVIIRMAAEGKRVDEIRSYIRERWPHYTLGQIAGAFTKARNGGVRIADSPKSEAARLEQERRRSLRAGRELPDDPNSLRNRIMAMAEKGLDVGEIGHALRQADRKITRGQIGGIVQRLRATGISIKDSAQGARTRAMNAALTPEERKSKAIKASNAVGDRPDGAAAVERARKLSASAWPGQKGDHRPDACRPKNTLGIPAAAPAEPARPRFGVLSCAWVDGDRRPWTLCEAPALLGVPFCEKHAAIGLERKRPARDVVDGAMRQT